MKNTATSKKEAFVTWLRFFACILITNSHCRDIYPYYFLAVGGGHGNAIFFALSGFCLANIKQTFFKWYGRRLKRLIPTTIIIVLISMIFIEGFNGVGAMGIGGAFLHYVNKYWFIPAILIYYCIFYFIFENGNSKTALYSLIVYTVVYFILYFTVIDRTKFSVELEGFSLFKVYYYLGIFIAGGLLRQLTEKLTNLDGAERKKKRNISIAVIAVSAVIWCGVYAAIMVFGKAFSVQFLIHAGVFAFTVALMVLMILYKDRIKLGNGFGSKLITTISESTLEIYLVQVTFKQAVTSLGFPINWFAFVIVAFIGGIILHELTGFIIKPIDKRKAA